MNVATIASNDHTLFLFKSVVWSTTYTFVWLQRFVQVDGCGTQLCLFLRENWPINSFATSTLKSRSVYLFFIGLTEGSLYTMKALVMQRLITKKKMYFNHFFAGLPTGVLLQPPPWSDDSFPKGEAARPQHAHLLYFVSELLPHLSGLS